MDLPTLSFHYPVSVSDKQKHILSIGINQKSEPGLCFSTNCLDSFNLKCQKLFQSNFYINQEEWHTASFGIKIKPIWFNKPQAIYPTLRKGIKPVKINIKTLTDILKSKKRVLIYTGAGISTPQVPSLDQIWNGINTKNIIDKNYPVYLFNNSAYFLNLIKNKFKEAYASPTKAHFAIKQIIDNKRDWCVATENLDFLHELSGIQPFRKTPLDGNELLSISNIRFNEYDFCLAIGIMRPLSNVMRNLREERIEICFIDLKPNYLMKEDDFFIQSDAQNAVVQLKEQLF